MAKRSGRDDKRFGRKPRRKPNRRCNCGSTHVVGLMGLGVRVLHFLYDVFVR